MLESPLNAIQRRKNKRGFSLHKCTNKFGQRDGFLCKSNTLAMSVDNKNKVVVGIPATSCRTNIRTFHLVDQAPNYHDHDFPDPNSKLVLAGYQIIRHKLKRSRLLSPPKRNGEPSRRQRCFSETRNKLVRLDICQDKLGRDKLKWPKSRQLLVQLYPSRAIESTNAMHVNHLISQITQERFKPVFNVVAIVDGGPDWSVKGLINFMTMGLLWKDLGLDCFVVQCYAPGHSRLNPIERLWSFLTNRIATITLPDHVKVVKPNVNDETGWLKVFDNAVHLCAPFWDGRRYGGYPIVVEPFKSMHPAIPTIKERHNNLKKFSNASKKRLKEKDFKELQDVYKFLVQHANRKAYQLEFVRCSDHSCFHCSDLPKRKNQFLEIINAFGGTCPSPQLSELQKKSL